MATTNHMAYHDYITAADLRAARERDARELIQVIHNSTPTVMKSTATNPATTARPLHVIAREINTAWSKLGKGIYFGAVPYLEALLQLNTIDQNYGYDTAHEMVLYFLANANSFRGEDAKRLKAELKAIAKIK